MLKVNELFNEYYEKKLYYCLGMNDKIFIVSGEASGDMHAANLVKELKIQNANLEIYAWGGDKMEREGAKILKHYRELAFMGFIEVIKNLPAIITNFKLIKKQILEIRPNVVVLVDYPGFNLRLLPWLKKNDFKVVYYIAPQAWAWKEGRTKQMAKYIDHLLVILPFEYSFFSSRNIQTEFVGHPLLQELSIGSSNARTNQIALLPGSRRQEISSILREMLSVVDRFPDYEFVIAAMSHIGEEFYRDIIGTKRVKIEFDKSEEVLKKAKLALVSSGTATLQTALLNTPQIVCYKSGRLNYEIGKRLIKVPYISLVNLIFGKEIVKELIQNSLNEENLFFEMSQLLKEENYSAMQADYAELRLKLGEKNASKRAAEVILAEL